MINGRLVRPAFLLIPTNQYLFQPRSSRRHLSYPQNSTSIASTLQQFIDSSSPSRGQTIHSHIIKSGFQPNINISIKLLILHLKCGSLCYARKSFDQMLKPTLSAYNYMIAGYFKQGLTKESLQLVQKLAFSDEKPDGFTLSMALKLSTGGGSLNLVKQVHSQITRLELGTDDVLIAALIDSYVKNGRLTYARRVFDAMSEGNLVCSTALIVGHMNKRSFGDAEEIFRRLVEKDTVIFNAMIEGYSRTTETAMKSLEVYKDMHCLSFRPTISSFVSVAGACSVLTALEFGQQVHTQTIKSCTFTHVKCGSALVDMYSKCGRVDDARRLFDHMPEKNVISWTSMIDGYGKNGNPHAALVLFNEMKKDHSVVPNHATFLSALSACGHAGLVSRGQEIFESMGRDYALKPRMEHYACMVDILGRMGSLSEAYNFIKEIPEEPNCDVWAALLGAARLHGNVEMADIAAKEVFELSSNRRPGAYIALSNTFAAAGKWEGVNEVRDLMKEKGVLKGAGSSRAFGGGQNSMRVHVGGRSA